MYVLCIFYGQTSWQKSMKTNISCTVRKNLLIELPLATIIFLSSLSLFLSFSLYGIANDATGNTQLASSDISYVNFLWQPSILYRRRRGRHRCCSCCCCCYLLAAPLCVDKRLRSGLEFQRGLSARRHAAGTSQNREIAIERVRGRNRDRQHLC